jgi:hypothetical protein
MERHSSARATPRTWHSTMAAYMTAAAACSAGATAQSTARLSCGLGRGLQGQGCGKGEVEGSPCTCASSPLPRQPGGAGPGHGSKPAPLTLTCLVEGAKHLFLPVLLCFAALPLPRLLDGAAMRPISQRVVGSHHVGRLQARLAVDGAARSETRKVLLVKHMDTLNSSGQTSLVWLLTERRGAGHQARCWCARDTRLRAGRAAQATADTPGAHTVPTGFHRAPSAALRL